MTSLARQPKANKTDAGNGSKAICRVSHVHLSPSPDPKRSPEKMNALRVSITAFADDGVPGWVECEMLDAEGDRHHFVEKVPVVSNEDLRHDSDYPREGAIACDVISRWKDDLGRDLSRVDTAQPWGVESTAGITEFVVLSNSIRSTK